MLRRILIIILVAVVIIAAIFAIQWFLNRDSDEADVPEGETPAVVEENEDGDVIEDAAEGSEDITDGSTDPGTTDPGTTDPGTTDPTEGNETEGDQALEGETETPTDGDEPAEAEEVDGDGDTVAGGEPGTGDADAGGGMPDEDADNLGETVAVDPEEAGMGGSGESSTMFVQPGVPTQHYVENLEWLTQLARCYGTTVADIQAANNYACPDLIHPGWVVNIANPGNAGPITINEMPCFVYHTVQQGETLYSIANIYGIHYQWLARINAIYNYNYIYAGQTLVIPNPVDPVFTQPPAEPYFYSNCWNCPVYPVHPIYPVPEPYGQ